MVRTTMEPRASASSMYVLKSCSASSGGVDARRILPLVISVVGNRINYMSLSTQLNNYLKDLITK